MNALALPALPDLDRVRSEVRENVLELQHIEDVVAPATIKALVGVLQEMAVPVGPFPLERSGTVRLGIQRNFRELVLTKKGELIFRPTSDYYLHAFILFFVALVLSAVPGVVLTSMVVALVISGTFALVWLGWHLLFASQTWKPGVLGVDATKMARWLSGVVEEGITVLNGERRYVKGQMGQISSLLHSRRQARYAQSSGDDSSKEE